MLQPSNRLIEVYRNVRLMLRHTGRRLSLGATRAARAGVSAVKKGCRYPAGRAFGGERFKLQGEKEDGWQSGGRGLRPGVLRLRIGHVQPPDFEPGNPELQPTNHRSSSCFLKPEG